MATLKTSNLVLPTEVQRGIIKKVQDGSAVAALSGSEPVLFGDTTLVSLGDTPRAEFLGESEEKGSSTMSLSSVVASPRKAQTTLRTSDEFLWADQDYRLGVFQEISGLIAKSLERALDFGVLHAINPKSGATMSGVPHVTSTDKVIESGDDAELDIEAAYGLLIADGEVPDGLALDPALAFSLATKRDDAGRRVFPDMPLNPRALGNFSGLPTHVGSTVPGTPEAASDTGIRGILGDWSSGVRWGIARQIPLEIIQYGDPDGGGDLKRKNEIAIRAEVAWVWHAFAEKFAVIKDEDPEDP